MGQWIGREVVVELFEIFDKSVPGKLKCLWHIVLGLGNTRQCGKGNQFMELSMPLPPIMIILLLFVKMMSKVFKVWTVHKNEYENIHRKYATRHRDGKLLRKLLISMTSMLSLKTIQLEMWQTMMSMLSKRSGKKIKMGLTMVRLQWNFLTCFWTT